MRVAIALLGSAIVTTAAGLGGLVLFAGAALAGRMLSVAVIAALERLAERDHVELVPASAGIGKSEQVSGREAQPSRVEQQRRDRAAAVG
jgi:hypothetical protein